MHTGEPVLSEEGRYHGMGVHRTARIMAAGHGGQILASQSTASVLSDDELDGIALRDLGEHKLKDLAQPERIYELRVDGLRDDFPPLNTERAATTPLYRRPLVVGAFAGVLAAAVAIPVFAFGRVARVARRSPRSARIRSACSIPRTARSTTRCSTCHPLRASHRAPTRSGSRARRRTASTASTLTPISSGRRST